MHFDNLPLVFQDSVREGEGDLVVTEVVVEDVDVVEEEAGEEVRWLGILWKKIKTVQNEERRNLFWILDFDVGA